MSKSTISTFQLFERFPDEPTARIYLESRLWPNGPRCPQCAGAVLTARPNGFYRCNPCGKFTFSVREGTIFGRSKIPLHKWIYAMYLVVTSRKGISSLQLPPVLSFDINHRFPLRSRLICFTIHLWRTGTPKGLAEKKHCCPARSAARNSAPANSMPTRRSAPSVRRSNFILSKGTHKMKRFALLFALCSTAAFAASWDGRTDDLTIFTVQLNSDVFGVAGVAGVTIPGVPQYSLELFALSTDPTVTAFRVTIEFTDSLGSHTETRTSSVSSGMMTLAGFFAGVKAEQVSSVVVTRLHDGQSTNVVH